MEDQTEMINQIISTFFAGASINWNRTKRISLKWHSESVTKNWEPKNETIILPIIDIELFPEEL